jgi:hypothetical protein
LPASRGVAATDGALTIVDGQHRASAAKLRSDIPHLPCVITSYANAGDEAAAFVALNQMRRPLSALDLFKAAVAAEDTEALEIVDCSDPRWPLDSAALELHGWKPGMVQNVGGLAKNACAVRAARPARLRSRSRQSLSKAKSFATLERSSPASLTSSRTSGRAATEQRDHPPAEEQFMPGMIDMVNASTQKEWADDIIKRSPANTARAAALHGRSSRALGEFLDAYFEEDEALRRHRTTHGRGRMGAIVLGALSPRIAPAARSSPAASSIPTRFSACSRPATRAAKSARSVMKGPRAAGRSSR